MVTQFIVGVFWFKFRLERYLKLDWMVVRLMGGLFEVVRFEVRFDVEFVEKTGDNCFSLMKIWFLLMFG